MNYTHLFLLYFISSCSSLTFDQYKEKYGLAKELIIDRDYITASQLISKTMPQCYTVQQSSDGIIHAVDLKVEKDKELARVYYIVKNNPVYPDQIIYYVELQKLRDDQSKARVYAKGDVFRSTESFVKNIEAWTADNTKACFK